MKKSAEIIQQKLDSLSKEGLVTVMLTGGKSAEQLYIEWQKLENFKKLTNTMFYFGDERCVPLDSPESNFGMAMKTLFINGLPNNCKIYRIQADKKKLKIVARQYSRLLPNSIDILILGLGDDGHIASLFPYSSQLNEQNQLCIPVVTPKPPYKRLTITPLVVKNAKTIYILAPGRKKQKIVECAKKQPININRLPIQMIINPIWCVD